MSKECNEPDETRPELLSLPRRPLPPGPRSVVELSADLSIRKCLCEISLNDKANTDSISNNYWPDKSAESQQDRLNEADTCRKYVTPKLIKSGWDNAPHQIREQYQLTDGRITVIQNKTKRGELYRADYLLTYNRDFPIAVVEAKPESASVGKGMQQAKNYAEILGLKFAYATNGHEILEFDFLTGIEKPIDEYPTPDELINRLTRGEGLDNEASDKLLTAYHHAPGGFLPRYYQQIAINRTVLSILQGKKRNLITMATGTGKTVVAFQICWKLWNSRWNTSGEYRKPRILFLADRNVLIDDPKDKTFAPFADARYKIEGGKIVKSREMYFAIYQSIAKDKNRPGLYKEFAPDFFDLIIVDECHRGSARDDSNWRDILEYFKPAYQVGMTATPLRDDNRDTYKYFENPLYTYSLAQGIEDGFLAPYRVHRIITQVDATGWRPTKGEVDRYGREIPDEEYGTKDFEHKVVLKARTEAIAKNITDFLKRTDRFAKTIVFCVDQSHADEMRRALSNLNSDLVKQYPDYVARVTSDEKKIGKGHLSRFQELETSSPVILTTSQLLTTGVDAPTCKNVIIVRVVNSMSEFKQIIGRGTRLREDYGKLWFSILDYTGSATQNFADPTFDGFPDVEDETIIDIDGNKLINISDDVSDETDDSCDSSSFPPSSRTNAGGEDVQPKLIRYYVDGGSVSISTHVVYEFDETGKQLKAVQFTDYTAESVRTLFSSQDDLRDRWADPVKREDVITTLAARGIDFKHVSEEIGKPDVDPFDLLCHLAFDAPLRTRRERAEYLRKENPDFFDRYGPQAREVLEALLNKYREHGPTQFNLAEVVDVPPISNFGNLIEIAGRFGGPREMKSAVDQMQSLLYHS